VKTTANGDFAASNPADKLFDLIQAFKTVYLQNARWVTTREVIAKVRKFKESTTNAYMWQPGLAQGTPDTLLGYPIVIAQDVPALATGSLSMWLGDWMEAYQIVDRFGIRTLRDPFTDKPYVHFYSTRRVGGGVVNFEALKAISFEKPVMRRPWCAFAASTRATPCWMPAAAPPGVSPTRSTSPVANAAQSRSAIASWPSLQPPHGS
jgi:predicted phage gp36 major capsid-like protein